MPRNADQPIRIRFEHTRYPHWGGRSGYTRFVGHLSRQFQTVVHGASDSDEDFPRWLSAARPLVKRLIKRGKMPWYKLSDFSAECGAFRACLRGQIDIVHFLDGEHSGQFLPRVLRFAGLNGIRTIASFHQPPDVLKTLLDPEILCQLDQIVLVSPSQLSFFKQYVPDDRLHVILHGVDTGFFCPVTPAGRSSSISCITVGHWLRDWAAFRAVAERLPAVTFNIVTSRDIELEGRDNVRQHRNVSDAELVDLYRAADVLFLPLIDATANNGLLEGIASGLPVIVSDIESMRAYLSGSEAIFVAENRVDGFVAAIERLRENADLRMGMGGAARARAEELSWPKVARQYEELYRAALVQPRASARQP